MKIAELTHTFFPKIGGAEVVVHELARNFIRLGHETVVIAPWGVRHVRRELDYRTLPLPPKALMAAARVRGCSLLLEPWIRAVQRRERFDVWHLHALFPTAYAIRRPLAAMRVPSIATPHGGDIQICHEAGYGLRREARYDRRIRQVIPEVTRLCALNRDIAAELVAIGAAPDRVVHRPNGIGLERFRGTRGDVAAVRRAMDWPEGTVIILTVGRNHPKKGFDRIPAIVATLRQRTRGFLWVIVGRGTEEVRSQARRLGVDDLLRFVPEIATSADPSRSRFEVPPAEILHLYQAADIFAFPTLIEAHPLVILEAMASGIAIATTDAQGCRDTLEHGSTGLLSAVGDVEGMAANLTRLIDDPALRSRLVAAAGRAIEAYDWPLVAESYLRIFREAAAEVAERRG